MSTTITYVGFTLALVYGVSFYLIIKAAGKDQFERYKRTFSYQRKMNFLLFPLIIGAIAFKGNSFGFCFAVAAVFLVLGMSNEQFKKMKKVEFDPVFTNRVFYSSFLAVPAIGLLLMGDFISVYLKIH